MQTGKISQRIKTYMDKRGMDLKSLAEQTGLTVPFVENMLTENVYPPLGNLLDETNAAAFTMPWCRWTEIFASPTGRSGTWWMSWKR